MAKVRGIGGVFLRARDRDALAAWYRDRLGLDVTGSMAIFPWRQADDPDRPGHTVWSVFEQASDYFEGAAMVNYRVDDLAAALADLERDGVHALGDVYEDENGRFAWIHDPEGDRIELWEPAPGR